MLDDLSDTHLGPEYGQGTREVIYRRAGNGLEECCRGHRCVHLDDSKVSDLQEIGKNCYQYGRLKRGSKAVLGSPV